MTWNLDIPKAANQVLADVADINENLACLQYINIWIPAAAMIPHDNDGAEFGSIEYTANDNVQVLYYAFDGASEEYVATSLVMPENWNRGTIKAKFYWTPGDSACSAGDTVEWQIQGIAISDDDDIDAIEFTDTGEVISDTVLAGKDSDLHITAATPAVTINNTPALGDLVNLKISRNVGGTDDMTEDAWLLGVYLQLGINEAIAAW